MKFYHNTSESAYKSILADGVIYAGGKEVQLTEIEAMQREHDAGALFSHDSQDCVCLSLDSNPAFGDVTLEVEVGSGKLEFYAGDFWEADTPAAFDTLKECKQYCREESIPFYCIEVRYYGDITKFCKVKWNGKKWEIIS